MLLGLNRRLVTDERGDDRPEEDAQDGQADFHSQTPFLLQICIDA